MKLPEKRSRQKQKYTWILTSKSTWIKKVFREKQTLNKYWQSKEYYVGKTHGKYFDMYMGKNLGKNMEKYFLSLH
jgi:hypothetical protein